MINTLKSKLLAVAAVSLLVSTPFAADQVSVTTELDKTYVNYLSSDGIIYLMDDTDPRKVCEMADKYSDNGVKEVYNVKTLVNATCGVTVQ